MARLLLAIAAVSALGTLAGCGPGPINDRLYPQEWKSKIRTPIPVYRQWKYEGEWWERVTLIDGTGPEYVEEEGN